MFDPADVFLPPGKKESMLEKKRRLLVGLPSENWLRDGALGPQDLASPAPLPKDAIAFPALIAPDIPHHELYPYLYRHMCNFPLNIEKLKALGFTHLLYCSHEQHLLRQMHPDMYRRSGEGQGPHSSRASPED
jgi:hypothetical protein